MATGGIASKNTEPGASHLTYGEIKAAVDECHKLGKKIACHAQGREGIKNAIEAGVDSIEHGIFLDDELIDLMIKKDVFLVPTLSVFANQMLPENIRKGIPQFMVDKIKKIIDVHKTNMQKAISAGVKIAMGTDAGSPCTPHSSVLNELILLSELGMDPMDGIICSTRNAANAIGLENEIGTIEEGKIADLIIVEGDPTKNLRSLEKIKYIMKEGKVQNPEF